MDQSGYLPYPKSFATRAIHSGQDPDSSDSKSIVPPIVISTIFKQETPLKFTGYEYGRHGNPSKDTLEACLASLENAKHALCVASGMAAAATLLSTLKTGDHVVAGEVIYGGVYRLCKEYITNFGIEFTFVDSTNVAKVEAAIKPNTKVIWLETPANPSLNVSDIRAVSKLTKPRNIILAVDNTFLTPYLQRPLEFGADVSVYSLTKYMNGHSDVTMGALVTNCDDIYKRMRALQVSFGSLPSPFDCALVTRGLKTLPARMRIHSANALAIAKYLDTHKNVAKVLHPGLPHHPQHELSKSQTSGHSGILAIYIKGGIDEAAKFVSSLKIFTISVSVGGIDSRAVLPATMIHPQMSRDERNRLGITENLVRITVGMEDVEDLIADLDQALNF